MLLLDSIYEKCIQSASGTACVLKSSGQNSFCRYSLMGYATIILGRNNMLGEKILLEMKKPEGWPVNAKECGLENIYTSLKKYNKDPSYKNKEVIVALVTNYDLNQMSMRGLCRNTEYEVALINLLYSNALVMNFNALKAYLYEYVGMTGRMQKMLSNIDSNSPLLVDVFEDLLPSLKLYYICYLYFAVEKDMDFSDKIIQIVEGALINSGDENFSCLTHAYVTMLNDLSYFECTKRNRIWAFSRDELKKLFTLEARLLKETEEKAIERPLKGVLMTTISNFVLKSRYDYNSDYISKKKKKKVALESVKNHEIWIRETTLLNDSREEKVIPELFTDNEWLLFEWASNIDFTRTRNYFVSSFCKNYNDERMKSEYGECVYGYKNDRLVELLSPVYLRRNIKGQSYPVFSQVIAFDVLYDKEEAKKDLNYLCSIIDLFELDNKEKNKFFEEIVQYWILSVKDSKWEHERERRYVLFMYDEYDYIDINTDDKMFLKLKTSIFLLPDFVLGDNPVKHQIRIFLANKRHAITMKNYSICPNCLSTDFDSFLSGSKECKICGSKTIDVKLY